MSAYFFELKDCTSKNLKGVEASLVKISNCKIYRTVRGEHLLFVMSDESPEVQLKVSLAPIKVIPVPIEEVPSTILG
jgi:hypothetical protein